MEDIGRSVSRWLWYSSRPDGSLFQNSPPSYVLFGTIVYVILLRVLKAIRDHDIELIDRTWVQDLGL